jgi:hypothetical protein
MADGTHKDIDDVDVGDRVLSTDPESGKTEAKRVTKLIEGFGTKTLVDIDVDGTTVTATDHHPFWANNTWTDAIDLKAGDNLRQDNGITTTVDGVNIHIAYNQHVNNLTVADFHTYYVSIGAENVLVHNAGCDEWAHGFQKQNGGEVKTFGESGGFLSLGEYALKPDEVVWFHHTVVVKDGKVYDEFTGSSGISVKEWKQLWKYGDSIDFGF